MGKCHVTDGEVEKFGHIPMAARQAQYAKALCKRPGYDVKKLGEVLKWKFGVCTLTPKARKTILDFSELTRKAING